jgi:acyl dehydratase
MNPKEPKPDNFFAYEDYEIGKKILLGSHQLTSAEIIEFANKWDPVPFHTDEQAGAQSIHGGLIAAGAHIIAIRIKLIQDRGISPYVIATMGWDKVRFIKPGRPGDTLSLSFECIEKRLSNSRPNCGIVTMYFEMTNQNNILILSLNDTILVQKRYKD